MNTFPACPVCENGPMTPAGYRFRDHVTGESFDLRKCHTCGFAQTTPQPLDLSRYYSPAYRQYGRVGTWILNRLYRRRVARWSRALPRRGLAVEIGSGPGWMLHALKEEGWLAIGSERTIEAAQTAQRGSAAPVFVGDINAVRPSADVDLLVLFHVLEHLRDPVAALIAASQRLAPGGTLILGLPNVGSWQARFARASWLHLDMPRHLCHFTPRSIEYALTKAGLRLTDVDFTSYEHDPLGWTQSMLSHLGFGDHAVLSLLSTTPMRGSSLPKTLAVALLMLPLTIVALALALASWRLRNGAVMEVWAVRDV